MNRHHLHSIILFFMVFSAHAVSDVQRTAVRDALKANDWDQALDLAEDLVDEHPKSSVAHFLLASALRVKMQQVSQVRAMFSLGDYKAALAKSIELDPKNIDARTEEIGFYLFAPGIAGGDKDLATERIKQLKAVSLYHGLQMEAQLAAVNEQTEQQGQLLQRMVDLEPDNPVGLMQLAGWQMQRDKHAEAEALLLRISGDEDAGWPLLAQYQRAKWRIVAKQELALAIELLQDYRQQLTQTDSELGLPPLAAAWWREAQAHEHQGDTQQAIEMLKRSLSIDEDFTPAEEDLDRLTE